MNAEREEDTAYDTSAENLKKLAEELILMLRIRSIPIGMKLFEDVDEMKRIPWPSDTDAGVFILPCAQLVGQVRSAGFTLGIVHENTRMNSNCGGIVGLNTPGASYLTGENMDGIWFENRESFFSTQAQMTRVEPKYSGLCAAPLHSGRLLDPRKSCCLRQPGTNHPIR